MQAPQLLGTIARVQKNKIWADFLGFTTSPVLRVFPNNLQGLSLAMSFPIENFVDGREQHIRARVQSDPTNTAVYTVSLKRPFQEQTTHLSEIMSEAPACIGSPEVPSPALHMLSMPYAKHILVPIPCPQVLLLRPERIDIIWETNEHCEKIGAVHFGRVSEPPLREDEIAALLSNPANAPAFAFDVGCARCQRTHHFFECIDEQYLTSTNFTQGALRIRELPDSWTCECGFQAVDPAHFKASIPFLFRNQDAVRGGLAGAVAQFRNTRMDHILQAFREIIRKEDVAEEEIQAFLEKHPIFWSFASPTRILAKPPILTDYRADFGIVTSRRELILVELEKPSTQLSKRDGGRHSKVQMGLDQINNWRDKIQRHRTSVLECMKVSEREAATVRYMLIAGTGTEAPRLRESVKQDTDVFTFEELGAFVSLLQSQIVRL